MPRDSAWRTSPTRRSQVSAGARPGWLQPSAAARPPGGRAPPFAPLLLSCWCSLSARAGSPGRRRMLGRLLPRGRCASPLPHCVHTRERPPSLPPALPPLRRPCAPFAVGSGRAGRGARDPRGAAAARGQVAQRGAHPAPPAQANLEELRPQFAQRHSLSGAFPTPALAPAGAVERRGGLPSPLAPLRSALRVFPGGRAPGARAGGDPHLGGGVGDPASGRREFWAGLGSSPAASFGLGADLRVTGPQCFPDCGWSLAGRGTSPGRRRGART